MPRSNDEWVVAVGRDDPAALAELRELLLGGLRSGLARHRVAEDLVRDFAQEALLKVRDRLPTFQGRSAFTTWALSLAFRIAFDELRRARWKDVSLEQALSAGQLPEPAEPSGASDRTLARQRQLTQLREALGRELTERQREALETTVALETSGMPIGQVAAHLGTNRNALYKMTHDARLRLKAALEARGVTAADIGWAWE